MVMKYAAQQSNIVLSHSWLHLKND